MTGAMANNQISVSTCMQNSSYAHVGENHNMDYHIPSKHSSSARNMVEEVT